MHNLSLALLDAQCKGICTTSLELNEQHSTYYELLRYRYCCTDNFVYYPCDSVFPTGD